MKPSFVVPKFTGFCTDLTLESRLFGWRHPVVKPPPRERGAAPFNFVRRFCSPAGRRAALLGAHVLPPSLSRDIACRSPYFARVIGVNRTEGAMGPQDRVELQITEMAVIDE